MIYMIVFSMSRIEFTIYEHGWFFKGINVWFFTSAVHLERDIIRSLKLHNFEIVPTAFRGFDLSRKFLLSNWPTKKKAALR